MSDKAKALLRKMKRRRLFGDPQARERVLGEFNRSTMDDVGPLGGQEGTKLLSEMNSLVEHHEEFVRSLASRVDVA
jgi:hypothetical protein